MAKKKNKKSVGNVTHKESSSVFSSKEQDSVQISEHCLLEECEKVATQKAKEYYKEKAKALLVQQKEKLLESFKLFNEYLESNEGLIEIDDGIFYLKAIHAIFPDPTKYELKTGNNSYFYSKTFVSKFASYDGELILEEELKELFARKHRLPFVSSSSQWYAYPVGKSLGEFEADDQGLGESDTDEQSLGELDTGEKLSVKTGEVSILRKLFHDSLFNLTENTENSIYGTDLEKKLSDDINKKLGRSELRYVNFAKEGYNTAKSDYAGKDNSYQLPVYRLRKNNTEPVSDLEVFIYFLLDEKTENVHASIETVKESFWKFKPYIILEENTLDIDSERFVRDFETGALAFDLNGEGEQKIQQMIGEVMEGGECPKEILASMNDSIKEFYLTSDERRVQLEPYGEDLLFEHTRGHWDLASNATSNNKVVLKLDPPFYARNPYQDIQRGSLIGIDFGTKSTVVACLDRKNQIYLLPVGKQGVQAYTSDTDRRSYIYENPTIMHICNIESFMQAYRSAKGRPETTWKDLAVAHTAHSQLSEANDANYYSFISNLKQWSASETKLRLIDAQGQEKEVPAYLDCQADDINPIEIYAYYIGMTINNMRQGIFTEYLLSFPVTYKKAVRGKILSSFRRGLQKSLPQVLAEDDEFVQNEFRVISATSEPAAYAVCALEAYGFEPDDQEVYYYGVFDFGGGTTDFDFGKWRAAITPEEQDRYEYVIEHFGGTGEEFLGGENLLDLLAFTVFSSKDNLPKLKEHNVYFTWPHGEEKKFSGFQDVIAKDSKWAHMNMQRMRELLRPMWERHPNYEDKFTESQISNLSLFTNTGEQVTDMGGLAVDLEQLEAILDDKIRAGIKSFMTGMMVEMSDISPRPEKINIFLAGNSCRSEKVDRIFHEEFGPFEEKYKAKRAELGEEFEGEIFELFPPLGTGAAKKKQEERKVSLISDGSYAPTGKTGVAVGLLKCRTSVKVIDANKDENDEIAFKFTIGKMRRNKLVPVLTSKSRLGGKWERFIIADKPEFDFYYTSKKHGVSGDLPIQETQRYTCRLTTTDDSASVFMRPKSPTEIEYVVARERSGQEIEPISEIVTIKLGVGE